MRFVPPFADWVPREHWPRTLFITGLITLVNAIVLGPLLQWPVSDVILGLLGGAVGVAILVHKFWPTRVL